MTKKIIFTIFILITFTVQIYSQVILSPYVVFMDETNKYGSLVVQNESFDSYEISISFIFGYPVSDSLGTRTMNYVSNPSLEDPSITSWIKVFPRKFVLSPKERQTVRLLVKPPPNIKDGSYWTRIVTQSTPIDEQKDSTTTGVSAKIKFVLNQITTAIFRKGNASTGLQISDVKLYKDSTDTQQILYSLKREGNSPFFGNFNLKIYNELGDLVKEESDYASIYVDFIRNYVLNKDDFKPGKYKAELEIVFNEKEDIPKSKMEQMPPIENKFEFIIP
ncbi:MAG: hypothetical protein GY936_00950 [Ignavibacteriae bacterium]|nr:hypothetical protein [Ignavibacteriota bacterium]